MRRNGAGDWKLNYDLIFDAIVEPHHMIHSRPLRFRRVRPIHPHANSSGIHGLMRIQSFTVKQFSEGIGDRSRTFMYKLDSNSIFTF
jgi:hypothetical protein